MPSSGLNNNLTIRSNPAPVPAQPGDEILNGPRRVTGTVTVERSGRARKPADVFINGVMLGHVAAKETKTFYVDMFVSHLEITGSRDITITESDLVIH